MFVFNFVCVVCDVFTVFCGVSWAALVTPDLPVYTMWFLPAAGLHYYSAIWVWKQAVLTVAAGALCIGFSVSQAVLSLKRQQTWTDRAQGALVFCFFVCPRQW